MRIIQNQIRKNKFCHRPTFMSD